MKNNFILMVACVLLSTMSVAQVTLESNAPNATNYVGFDNTSGIALPIRNEGDPRINISSNLSNKFAITELATWYGLNGLTRNNVQRTTMGLNGETDPAWSMLHLWSGLINIDTRRDWMNVGTSYIANGDVMYTGLLERPWADGDAQQTDAVIAWGCQIDEGFEDNFRIIFLEADADTTDQGTEMMRITPWGNIGMGNSFSNALQPHRRTVVHERRDSAQFRIAWGVDPNPVLGQHADFQVTGNGNLHIKPRNDNANRTVAIGFLSGELGNPVNNAARLDVGGRVRVRNLQDTLPAERVHASV